MSSFISTQFFALNLDGLSEASFNKLQFFGIPLLYYYTHLNLLIVFLSSGDMYLFLWAVISASSSWLLLGNSLECNSITGFFETLVILSPILLSIKSPVASAVFWIAVFYVVFITSVVDFLALLRRFWSYLLLKILLNLLVQLNISFL